MYCTYCKMARVENEAPCSNCGAPSPFFGQSHYQGGRVEQTREAMPGGTAFGVPSEQAVPQLTFDDPMGLAAGTPMPGWSGPQNYPPAGPSRQQPAEAYNPMPFWQQSAEPPTPPWQSEQGSGKQNAQRAQGSAGQQSLLPVPYNPGMGLQAAERQSTISLQLVPDHAIQHLLAPPEQSVGEAVYVAPMYTKPRPIVPRYRIVSGLLSIIIMALVVCAGTGYYAQTQGVLAKATRLLTGAPPQSIPLTSSSTIQDPPEQTSKDLGPAYNAIPSAVTTLNIDKNNLARQPAKIFKPGQTFYLVFSVQAPPDGKGGIVRTRWYTNDKFFTEITSQEQIKAGDTKSGHIQMRFTAPLSGRIELFWNDQFAQKLYFAVK